MDREHFDDLGRIAMRDIDPASRSGESVSTVRSSDATCITVVLMGVTASGKSRTMSELARVLGWPIAEGDDFHPQANIDKMRAGVPLTDADRWPWLEAIAAWIGRQEAAGISSIVTCSALRRSYRDRLRNGHPSVRFAHLTVPPDRLELRLAQREDHFMAASLLESQLATIEPLGPDEPGVSVDATLPPEVVAETIIERLGIAP